MEKKFNLGNYESLGLKAVVSLNPSEQTGDASLDIEVLMSEVFAQLNRARHKIIAQEATQ